MTESTVQKNSKPRVAIYYDNDCGFCKRSVELIVRWFFVRVSHVGPAQADDRVYQIMKEADSWVVENDKGELFTTFQAGVEIARHSPLLWLIVPLAKPRFMQRLGEWAYRKIAKNRSRIWLPGLVSNGGSSKVCVHDKE